MVYKFKEEVELTRYWRSPRYKCGISRCQVKKVFKGDGNNLYQMLLIGQIKLALRMGH